jgi:hypothetical protein
MKLYTNGCSFTWGGDLVKFLHHEDKLLDENNTSELNQYRLNITWPKHLSELLGCTEFHNHSLGCGSNGRIVRKTFDFFLPKIANNEDLSEWQVVIQWTDPSRFEYFDSVDNMWTLAKHDMIIFESKRIPNDKDQEFLKSCFRRYNNETWNSWFFKDILSLGYFLQNNNIKYVFTMIHSDVNTMAPHQIDYCNKFNWYKNDIKLCSITDMQVDKTSSKHPSLLGHQQIAKNLYDFLIANKNQ